MRKSRKLSSLFLVCLIAASLLLMQSVPAFATTGSATIQLSSTTAQVNDIILAYVNVSNISTISGYQFNIKYNQNVLQAVNPYTGVAYGSSTKPSNGNILINSSYSPLSLASNNIGNGILNAGKCYIDLESYRADNNPESTGTIAVIGFKVISSSSTPVSIEFQDTNTMPNAITGTYFFNWYGDTITDYAVIQPPQITIQ